MKEEGEGLGEGVEDDKMLYATTARRRVTSKQIVHI